MKKIIVPICIHSVFLFSGEGDPTPLPPQKNLVPEVPEEEELIVFEEEFDEEETLE